MMIKTLSIIICVYTVLCGVSHAATLNQNIVLTGDVLTVGDVFTDAGDGADHVLGPAPKAGNVLVLNTKTLERIATGLNVDWASVSKRETATIRVQKKPAQKDAQKKDEKTIMVKIPVLAAPLKRDDVITAGDVIWAEIESSKLNDNTALKESDIVGLAARGLIQPNVPITTNLLVSPKMIKRGDTVSLSLNAGQISLTAKGKALADARMGEIVRVQNPDSQKIVQARVTGPQEAVVEPQS